MLPRLTALLLPTAAMLCACSLIQPRLTRPTVTVIGIEMRRGSFLQQEFAVKLNVDNPNDRALPVRSLKVALTVAGDDIASGQSERAFTVPAHGQSEFDMTVNANLALALLKLGNKLNQHAETIEYDLDGSASVDLPFLSNLAFHQRGSLSLKNPGSISISN